MSKLYLLKPEVAGEQGPTTTIKNLEEYKVGKTQIPHVENLEYMFFGWLGDELLESFPCFIVTKKLGRKLIENGITGVKLTEVKVSKSEFFDEMEFNNELPDFVRLEPTGKVSFNSSYKLINWSGEDVCLATKAELVVTEKALGVLKQGSLNFCDEIEIGM